MRVLAAFADELRKLAQAAPAGSGSFGSGGNPSVMKDELHPKKDPRTGVFRTPLREDVEADNGVLPDKLAHLDPRVVQILYQATVPGPVRRVPRLFDTLHGQEEAERFIEALKARRKKRAEPPAIPAAPPVTP